MWKPFIALWFTDSLGPKPCNTLFVISNIFKGQVSTFYHNYSNIDQFIWIPESFCLYGFHRTGLSNAVKYNILTKLVPQEFKDQSIEILSPYFVSSFSKMIISLCSTQVTHPLPPPPPMCEYLSILRNRQTDNYCFTETWMGLRTGRQKTCVWLHV